MSLVLTYWEYPKNGQGNDSEAFEGILEVRLKSTRQIPELIAHMPPNCRMISTEYSGNHTRNGRITCKDNPRRFKELWRYPQPIPQPKVSKCPLCGAIKDETH